MPSESSYASWHPAFMPNSAADIIAKSTQAPESSSLETLAQSLESSKSYPPAPEPSLEAHQGISKQLEVQPPKVESIEDNTTHPELTNLRNALETSLASPGGVELDENPLHNGTSHHEVLGDEKAGFPSEGPTPSNKHLSTMSFARTISEEVTWGEDDEVDPEWNIHQPDTDPFEFMAKSDRTNSFPVVPPPHALPIDHDNEQLPHSQAEEIMHEIEEDSRDLFSDHGDDADADFFANNSATEDDTPDFLPESQLETKTDHHDYGQSYGREVRDEEDEELEARFEEGLPLVGSTENHKVEYQPSNSNHLSFMSDEDHEEDDFFAQASNVNPTHEEVAPQLTRKSTTQVMDSLHFQPQQAHQDITEGEDMASSKTSLDKVIGGGIVTSTTTGLSQVLGDPAAAIHDQPEALASLEMDSGEGDLAAKWKAALAGDEFLDDDDGELLPDDDEPTENAALDPAALFGSDDEGFLEDTEDQPPANNLGSQQTSPPIPTPVLGQNGHVMGFDNRSGSATQTKRPGSSGSSRYLPPGATTSAPQPANTYSPSAPLFTDLSRPATSSAVPSPYMSPGFSNFPPQQQPERPELPKAQSFADKSKGGYHSPYDLPMEVVKPRKRVSMQHMSHGYNATPPAAAPPRSSSMYAQPAPPSRGSTSSLSPPPSSHGLQQVQAPPTTAPKQPEPPKAIKKQQSGFFEELPMSKPKPAARHSSGYSPLQSPYGHPGSIPSPSAPPAGPVRPHAPAHNVPPPHVPSFQQQQQQPVQYSPQNPGLVAPERVSPYAALPSGNIPVPAVASRYSPAPPHPQSQTAPLPPVSQARYSPAPPVPRQPSYPPVTGASQSAPALPHLPRTSSPLAHFERSLDSGPYGSHSQAASFDRRSSSTGYESNLRPNHLPPTREVDENESTQPTGGRNYGELQNQYGQFPQPLPQGTRQASQTPPPPQGLTSRLVSSPPKRATSNYLPQQHSNGPPPAYIPLQRSQTQSPGTAYAGPKLEMSTSDPYRRPASVEMPTSPRANMGYATMSATSSQGRSRAFSQGLNYVAPTDGRELDPLQRWKGAPVFAWGVGGTIMTSFPKDVPRYVGQAMTIVRSPGEPKFRNIKDLAPLQERLASFPGPLKGKPKKKDVVSWLSSGIDILEQSASYLRTMAQLSHEDKRIEERILLWKILRVFIENDGILEGNPIVDKAVRAVLAPGLDDENTSSTPLYATGADLPGISHSSTSAIKAEAIDPAAVDQLRKHLLRGEREKAVWEAVDKRLWAHAMIISNTVSKELYKQVAQEFIQKEVKNIGDNTESLAALYEIFAGNFEESIDELVPPSARMGYTMVSTSNAAGPSKDALDGLDRWRETLGLVLSNRSVDDNQALNALGKLLSGYGRAEAAHVCFLFARSHSLFGGIDDPLSNMVLVGSDHLRQPYDFDREMEPILLSEVFEYGMSLSSASNILVSSPHLAVYKLQHATILAEYGYRDKALLYCEAIASSITSQTRRSPYHHAQLISALDDLSKRLKSSPKDETGSWISKPSIDKARGSVWATFNKFVAGDESDAASGGSNGGSATEVGPFARIAGGTPTISRSPSNSELYGSYNGGLNINGSAAALATKAGSRYAPGAAYTPPAHEPQSATSSSSQPRSSLEERSSNEFGRYEPRRQMSDYRPNSQPTSNIYTPQTSSSYTPQSSYTLYGNNGSPYTPQNATPVTEQPSNHYPSPQRVNTFDEQPTSYTPPEPSYSRESSSGYEPPALNTYESSVPNAYEPPSNYEPPASTGYEPPSNSYTPPSYEPATMNDEPDSPIDTRPKKKSFMDDDDDDIPALKAAAQSGPAREKTKEEKDREADEAFRKAAEADGMPLSHF
jgi:hypothetical protein